MQVTKQFLSHNSSANCSTSHTKHIFHCLFIVTLFFLVYTYINIRSDFNNDVNNRKIIQMLNSFSYARSCQTLKNNFWNEQFTFMITQWKSLLSVNATRASFHLGCRTISWNTPLWSFLSQSLSHSWAVIAFEFLYLYYKSYEHNTLFWNDNISRSAGKIK